MGWVIDASQTDADWPVGKTIRCPDCYDPANDQQRTKLLESLHPLSAQERDYRLIEFDTTQPTVVTAYNVVTAAVEAKRGLILLYGDNGIGKSRLLISAVNELRATKTTIYAPAEGILKYLRAGFDPEKPHTDPSYDQRWALIQDADLLAIDELEKYNATDWAAKQFLALIDHRWRFMANKLTLLAMNGDWFRVLDPTIRDRCQDGRAKIVEVSGTSYRPALHWSDDTDD